MSEQVRPPPLLSYISSAPAPEPRSQRDGTHWGTMVIWTKQMKRKTSEAHAT